MGGMNFVTGEESVPENTQVNQTLTSMVNQPESLPQEQNNVGIPSVQEVAGPTLSSVINQPESLPQEQNNVGIPPVQEVAGPTLSSAINQPESLPQEQSNVQPIADTPNQAPTGVENSSINNVIENNMPTPQVENVSVAEDENEDVKQKKLKKFLVVLVIILALTAIGILLGFVLFDKFGNKGESAEETTVTNNELISVNEINNVNLDATDLETVLGLLGISTFADNNNINALTYYVTNENYRDNAKEIITYYAILGTDMAMDFEDDGTDSTICADAVNCSVISKEDALKIIRLYNFDGDLEDYFYKSSVSNDKYGIHYGDTLDLPLFNGTNLGFGHKLTAKYIGDEDISVEDTQIFNYIEDGQVNHVDRVAKYMFKKNDNNEYYLDSVLINE